MKPEINTALITLAQELIQRFSPLLQDEYEQSRLNSWGTLLLMASMDLDKAADNLIEQNKLIKTFLKKYSRIIIEIQYLLNTLKDLTIDNIYHEHYNYWSLTSLINFFNQFNAKIFRAENLDTHGGSLRIYIKKNKKIKIENNVKKLINEEETFGIKDIKTYLEFAE